MLQTASIMSQEHLDLLADISLSAQKKHLIPPVLALGLFGFMLSVWQIISQNYVLLVLGIALMINVVTFFPLFQWLVKKLAVKNNLNAKLLHQENKNIITYHGDHAFVETFLDGKKMSELKLHYLALAKVVQYKHALFIYLSATQAFIVLQHEMVQGSYDELIDFFKSKLAARYEVHGKDQTKQA